MGKETGFESFAFLNDGVGLDVVSCLSAGTRFTDNLNGTDFVPFFLEQVKDSLNVALLGGDDGIAKKAGEAFKRDYPQHNYIYARHGYDVAVDVVEEISALGVDVLLVGMGNPIQEKFILNYYKQLGCKLTFCVGGLLDFASGAKPRSPFLMRRLKLEWFWRFCLEPKRLFKRYFWQTPKVFLAAIVYGFKRTRK